MQNDLKHALGTMRSSDGIVALSDSAAPVPMLRSLWCQVSEGVDSNAATLEREEVWKQAVAQRKNHVSFIHMKGNPQDKSSYASALDQAMRVQEFRGVAGEEHRVFVLSCDLMNQSGKKPWVVASIPDHQILAACCDFLVTGARRPSDVIMAWDGCHRKPRRKLEDTIGKLSGCAEVFLVYATAWNSWAKKQYILASENTECGYIALPSGRGKHSVKGRVQGLNAVGEATSHWTTFSGASPPPRTSLARLSPEDKLRVFPEETDTLPVKWTTNVACGVPMFWNETKSVSTWEVLLDEVNAKVVVDLTPGSGILAAACMSKGVAYTGLVRNLAHYHWLTNCVDTAALQYICQEGNRLYQEDLATHVRKLFADLVDQKDDPLAEAAITSVDMEL